MMGRVRRNWTPEEDTMLRRAVTTALKESRPLLWRELAKSVPGRSNKDCRRRWWNSLTDTTTKGQWSEEEDERLVQAVGAHGEIWRKVSKYVVSRTPDQCASHWTQVLNPDINHSDWDIGEDEKLLQEVSIHGTNWSAIAISHVPRRTTLSLKNRYATLRMRCANRHRVASYHSLGMSSTKPNSDFQGMSSADGAWCHAQNPTVYPGVKGGDSRSTSQDSEHNVENIGYGQHQEGDFSSESPNAGFGILSAPSVESVPFTSSEPSNSLLNSGWANMAQLEAQLPVFSSDTRLLSLDPSFDGHTPYVQSLMPAKSIPPSDFGDIPGAVHGENGTNRAQYSQSEASRGSTQSLYGNSSMTESAPVITSSQSSAPLSTELSYQVSVCMICTNDQLERLMASLTGAGACINLQVEPVPKLQSI